MSLRPIYYDTETTGIKAEKERIIEIAAYDPVRKRQFEKFVNPGFPIPPEAIAIHHITDEMVAACSFFCKDRRRIHRILRGRCCPDCP